MMLLLKIYQFCQQYPGSLALIVRREYTDLRDSTMKDFEKYFNCTIPSDKDFKFQNGSTIMFRHGSELDVLKNINLSIAGIEQAEEFDTDETFHFLRDRLRRLGSPYRQLCVIANAKGHNWIWRLWKHDPSSEEYDLSEATTFENADNLPPDFVDDLRRMEKEAPNHYKQYVLNSDEEVDADDLLFTGELIYRSPDIEFLREGTHRRIMSVDVARFGEDKTVFNVLESRNITSWEQLHIEAVQGWDTTRTVGKIISMAREFRPEFTVIDDTGVGGGVTDMLREQRSRVRAFISAERATQNALYFNKRAEGYFRLKNYFERGRLKILNDVDLMEQLMTIRYEFKSNGQKAIVSKDKMRKDGIKSPDKADALMMGMYYADAEFKANTNRLMHHVMPAVTEYDVLAH